MLQINHNQKYNKPEIVEALFKLMGNCEFFPIAYRVCVPFVQTLLTRLPINALRTSPLPDLPHR